MSLLILCNGISSSELLLLLLLLSLSELLAITLFRVTRLGGLAAAATDAGLASVPLDLAALADDCVCDSRGCGGGGGGDVDAARRATDAAGTASDDMEVGGGFSRVTAADGGA